MFTLTRIVTIVGGRSNWVNKVNKITIGDYK